MKNLLSTQLACREVNEARHPDDFGTCDANKDFRESCNLGTCDYEKFFFETCKCIFIQSK